MKIVVCMKQTFDTEARIALTGEGRIDDRSVLLIVNPYDEYAVEEAIRIKEKQGGEVTVVTVGGDKARKALQQCLAMGADHAVLVDDAQLNDADGHTYALVLSRVLKEMEYDLILCGRESVDEAASKVHTRLAEILDLPQANVVSALKVEDGKAEAKRDIEGGSELMEVDLPAVISVQKGINEVRYPSLRLVMKASRHPIKTLSLEDLGLSAADIKPFLHVEAYLFPKPRQGGRRLTGEVSEMVSDLIQYLRDEVQAI